MKSQLPFHGVTSAQLKALLGPLLADDALRPATREAWEATVRDLWDNATHREQRYAATALLAHRSARRWHDPDLLPLLRHLIVTGAWWDHVDDIATHHVAPILLRHRETVTPTMLAWARGGDPLGDDLWLRRTAIICQLPHKGATDVALLTAAIDANLETDARGSARHTVELLDPHGDRLGAAPTGPHRPAMDPRLRGGPPGSDGRALDPRGAQAPGLSDSREHP